MIQIRRAELEDIPKIMQFIDEHWKKGHIMATNRTLFEFQHVEGDEVHYVMAEDTDTKCIYGTMGYITMNHSAYPAISTVMIRALANEEYNMLGEEMYAYFIKYVPCGNMISVGVKKRYALAMEGIESGHVDKLKHYYRLRDLEGYKVARIVHKELLPVKGDGTLQEITDCRQIKDIISDDTLFYHYPYRDYEYIKHRYFEHPYYTYNCYQICYESPTESLLIARECEAEGVKVLRIVDYVGVDEDLAGIGNALDKLMNQKEYEYIDFYCYGMDNSIMEKAGFVKKDERDSNIIPNYFEPFEQTNVDVYFYTWFMDGLHVYRGFGDQDRPSQV